MPAHLLLALLVVGGIIYGEWHGERWGQRNPPCLEDQAYVVAEDRNPDHGLTWVCVDRGDLK